MIDLLRHSGPVKLIDHLSQDPPVGLTVGAGIEAASDEALAFGTGSASCRCRGH